MKHFKMILQLFAEGGAAGPSGDTGSEGSGAGGTEESGVANQKADLSHVVYGKQVDMDVADPNGNTTNSKESKASQFENLIKGEFKEEFAKRTQGIIDERFKASKGMQERAKKTEPILAILSDKYGVGLDDIDALSKAIQEDDTFYKEAAMEAGLTVKQYKEMRALERQNEELLRAKQEQEKVQQSREIYSKWIADGEALSQKYGVEFDLQAELENQDFTRLLRSGVGVEGAYKAVHFDDMIGGAMAKTASAVSQKIAQSIGQRAARPAEGGVMAQSATTFKRDVGSLTKADREEIERRALRGEVISF